MRVCLDLQSAIGRRTGVGRYTHSLARHLCATAAPDDSLTGFFFDFRGRGAPELPDGMPARRVRWIPGRIVQQSWQRLHFPPFDWMAGAADLYHFPNFIMPPLARGKAVVTIHDAAFLALPHTTEKKNLRYLQAHIRSTVNRADLILTLSRAMAVDLSERLKVPLSKIRPIHLGIEPYFAPPPAERLQAVKQRYTLQRPYLAFLSTLEPRKNIPFLIEVFERLSAFDGDLVIVGQRGWSCDPILDRMRRSPCANRIRHIEYAPEEDLPSLYAGAECFVFPTLYEGFGFPPLEAMACGTPVVASSAAALCEVLGDAAEIVPEFNAERWADAVMKVLRDSARRSELTRRGLACAAGYTWEKTARETWAAYRGTV